ncbi:MAG: serine kinase [Bacteroidales bacterium]|nr:serine kinase [Bacteroidales bacterium]
MKVCDMMQQLDMKLFSGASGIEKEITGGYSSDLLSDVMGNAEEGQVWITLQTHKNIMAVASLKEVSAIVLVKNLQPEDDVREISNEEGIPILGTAMDAFTVAGKIYAMLK